MLATESQQQAGRPTGSADRSARPWIKPITRRLDNKLPVLSFTVGTAGRPFYEVLLATDRGLFLPSAAGRRTPSTFYASRQDGGLSSNPGGAEAVTYIAPQAVLQGFAQARPRSSEIYYTAVAYADAQGGGAVFAQPSDSLSVNAPSVSLAIDFQGHTLARGLSVSLAGLRRVTSAPPEHAVFHADPSTDAAEGEDGMHNLTPADAPNGVHHAAVTYTSALDYIDGFESAQDSSFPLGAAEPGRLVDDGFEPEFSPTITSNGSYGDEADPEEFYFDTAPDDVGMLAAAARPAERFTTDARRHILQQIAEATGRNRYQTVIGDAEHDVAVGLVPFSMRRGELHRLLGMMRSRDHATFQSVFGAHADELVRDDGPAAVARRVDDAYLWEPKWRARFEHAAQFPAFKAAQNQLASDLCLEPMVSFAGWLGLNTDRALAMVVAAAMALGIQHAQEWVVQQVGALQTPAQRQQALAALGHPDVRAFQAATPGLDANGQWDSLTQAALVGALREHGEAQSPVPLPVLEQMLDSLVRQSGEQPALADVARLRTAGGFTDAAFRL